MNIHRKQTIVQEIEYWKKNRMLPDQYCNYLLALYTEGEAVQGQRGQKKKMFHLFFSCLILSLIPITFLVIYFTEMPVHLQMVLVTFFILLSFIGYFTFRKEQFFIHIPVVISAFLILILSIKLLEATNFKLPTTFTVITFQALTWFILGYLKKWYYLNIAAIIIMVLLVINIIAM
ncbi:hypothetical protein M3936_15995 [Sutcliffiella horikoshii]|uniref:hypothetical protein n=1 Tax=Sutcliffiella horikoshii TaxID=79883 RepID=UPI00203E48E3|nr:hypothetical protein [Sutcliffiella horikoshii]MCM3619091.1 hypothetical protein [Sutcliffiella horikoshii]